MKRIQVFQFNTNDSIQHYPFVCTQLNGSKYCYEWLTFQLNSPLITHTNSYIFNPSNNSNISIWPIDRTLPGATTPGESVPGSNDNEKVLCIPQSSSITGASPSDCLVSYPGHALRGGASYRYIQQPGLWKLRRNKICIIAVFYTNQTS